MRYKEAKSKNISQKYRPTKLRQVLNTGGSVMTAKPVLPQSCELSALYLHQGREGHMETEIHTVILRSSRPSPSAVSLVESCHAELVILGL